ncbi:toxin-antitoxin system HicB family antitoxin [Demequina sp. SO4-13]|uniref:toxin-antitoxin system HicB family antitoxin n=1 Tax=Demequina sp. SO4-13 TaxID=3401027 RepID=UPI003AF69DEE
MDLQQHSARLREQLLATSAAGTPKTREAAERLTTALAPAVHMMLVEALGEAVEEISRELEPGAVDLRVRGKGVEFVVTAPGAALAEERDEADAQAVAAALADDAISRTTLRLPDALKARAEVAAAAEGLSLNSWLVRAATLHLEPGPRSRRGRAAARFAGWADSQD